MSTQNLSVSAPTLGHKYYASLMFKSSDTFSYGDVADNRYEWYYNDTVNVGTLIFSRNGYKTSSWMKVSSIKSVEASTYLANSWKIRNFQVGTTDYSYTDSLVLIDLTETFGEGNEPTKEWCDKHLNYFDGTTTVTWNGISMPSTISGTRIHLNIEEVGANDKIEYTFIINSSIKPTNIDFNDVNLSNIEITDLGNDQYSVHGFMPVTDYMVAGVDIRSYAYDTMRFFDIHGNSSAIIEKAHIINYNHFYN